jgi:hypothetical protein
MVHREHIVPKFRGLLILAWDSERVSPSPMLVKSGLTPDTFRAPEIAQSSLSSSVLSEAPAQAQIVHAGQACVVKEDNISERVYTIRESDTLVLQCLVTGHPRPQVRWTLALLGSYSHHAAHCCTLPGIRV